MGSLPGRRDEMAAGSFATGCPVMMSPERAAHALTKFAAQKALETE